MAQKIIHAMFNDDDVLLKGAKEMVAQGVHIDDVYSPMPIHGLDPVIGVKESNLGIAAFIYGSIGLSLALFGIYYFMILDWPMNIGGKPSFYFYQNLPAFIPICFEFTVLCTAHGMALTYLLRNGTLPFVKADNPDPRTTDDKFVMEIKTSSNHGHSVEEINEMLKAHGAIEINEKEL